MGRIRRRGRIFVSCDQLDADWSVGALGCWFSLFPYSNTPALHYSRLSLLRRISFGHLVEETFFLKFLQKTQVDELLRLSIFRLRQLRRNQVQHVLDPL